MCNIVSVFLRISIGTRFLSPLSSSTIKEFLAPRNFWKNMDIKHIFIWKHVVDAQVKNMFVQSEEKKTDILKKYGDNSR